MSGGNGSDNGGGGEGLFGCLAVPHCAEHNRVSLDASDARAQAIALRNALGGVLAEARDDREIRRRQASQYAEYAAQLSDGVAQLQQQVSDLAQQAAYCRAEREELHQLVVQVGRVVTGLDSITPAKPGPRRKAKR